jgi:DNA polymerase I
MPDVVFLIDTFSLMFQVFHGIPPMTSPAGLPTNAVFGFSRDLVSLLQTHKPGWLICAMESPGPGFRDQLYPEYKANRSEMPEDLRPQIPLLIEVIESFRIPVIQSAGWEADDVIATLTRQAVERGRQVRIVTSDKDARQLLGPQVQMYNLRKNTFLDEAALLADWGVRPDQVVDFQSLVGDSVDNVPGVPLVGPKKASALLQQFETLEGVLANADKAPGAKLKQNLVEFADQARLSRQLVRLNQHLDLNFDWDAHRTPQPDVAALQELFRKLGFRRLVDDVKQFAPAGPAPASPRRSLTPRPAGRSLFDDEETSDPSDDASALGTAAAESTTALPVPSPSSSEEKVRVSAANGDDAPYTQTDSSAASDCTTSVPNSTSADATSPPLPNPLPSKSGGEGTAHAAVSNIPRDWETIDTPERFARFVDELRLQSRFCLDLETTSLDPRSARIVGWAFCWQPGSAYYLPTMGPPGSVLLDSVAVLNALRPILESPSILLVNQNVKYDLMVLDTHGVCVAPECIDVDPMVGDYLLDAGARSHSLDTLIQKYLGRTGIPISDLIGTGKNQKSMADIPVDKVAEYATEDADLSLQLADLIGSKLHEQGLWDLYWNLERSLIPILVEMEQTGIRVDAKELQRQSDALTQRLSDLMAEIHKLAGHEFNIDSPKQLQVVLFDELNLPVKKKTKTGASTNQDVLEELAPLHPLPAKIIEHRHLSKLKGTYLDALPQLIHPRTGRIHTSFNQVVAATGRLSSSDPNLQNIPIRTPEGEQIRRAFIASGLGTDETLLVPSPLFGREKVTVRGPNSANAPKVPRDLFSDSEPLRTPIDEEKLLTPTFSPPCRGEGTGPWKLVCADYSQIELRILAHFSQDRELIAAFEQGVDIHTAVAAQVFGVDRDSVSRDQRRMAKAVNFGVIYGQSPYGLAAALGIEQEAAATFIDGYFAKYSGVTQFIEETLSDVERTGVATTILGRRRAIDGIRSLRTGNLNMPERTAVNTVIQGSAADLIKRAMLAVHSRLRRENHPARMLLQIHDELVFETPLPEVTSLVDIVRHEMQHAMELSVPLVVDVSVGDNWLDTLPV